MNLKNEAGLEEPKKTTAKDLELGTLPKLRKRLHKPLYSAASTSRTTPQQRLKCYLCEKGFYYPYQVRDHFQHGHPEAQLCVFCKKMFGNLDQMKTHQEKMHPGKEIYRCQNCKFIGGDSFEINSHNWIVHKEWICDDPSYTIITTTQPLDLTVDSTTILFKRMHHQQTAQWWYNFKLLVYFKLLSKFKTFNPLCSVSVAYGLTSHRSTDRA